MKIREWIQSISFTRKLILIFTVVMILPLILVSFIFYRISGNMIRRSTRDYLENLSSVTLNIVDTSVRNVEDTAFFIAGNTQLQEILKGGEELTRQEQHSQYEEGRKLLSNYVLMSSEISSAYILTSHDNLIGFTKQSGVAPKDQIRQMPAGWNLEDGILYLKKEMRSYPDQSYLGDLVMAVNAPLFYNAIKDIFPGKDSEAFLINEDREIIAGQQDESIGNILEDAYSRNNLEESGSLMVTEIHGQRMGRYISEPIHNGWRMILALPEQYYMKDIYFLRNFVFALSIVTGMISFALIVLVGSRLTRSIKSLSQTMHQVGQGDFEVKAPVESRDEIGVLSDTFNHMVADMRMLIDNVYRQEMLKQEVEMRSLQMQINPHFLYNTLDTINWIARMRGIEEIGEMTTALGSLMRYSLSRKDFVTIREELENLKNYISIQNVRYGDRMQITFSIAEDTLDFYIPKLLVQPILENAIVHGIEDKIDPGQIEIRSHTLGEHLYLTVEDDGVGMTQEAIESLLQLDKDRPKQGHTSIGVYNVNRRIQAVFGRGCGLQIQSQLGAGTKITLHMKKLTKAPDMKLKYDQ